MAPTASEALHVLLVDPVGELDRLAAALERGDDAITTETVPEPAELLTAEKLPGCLVVLHAPAEGIDGVEQFRATRERAPGAPIVIFAIDPAPYYAEEALDAGADDVICVGHDSRMEAKYDQLLVRRIRHAAGKGESFQTDSQLLESLLEYLPHQIFIKDDTGRIAEASRVTAEEYGYSREQLIGLTDYELFPPDFADDLWAEERRIMDRGEPIINKVEHYVDDEGRDRWVSTTKAPRYDDEDNVVGIIGSTRDITDRRRKEEILHVLHTASRDLVDAETKAEIARVTVDIADAIPDLPVVQVALDGEDGLSVSAASEGSERRFERHREEFERAHTTRESQFVRPGGKQDGEPPDPTGIFLPLGAHGVLGITATSGAFDTDAIELAEVLAANVEAALDRAEREGTLRRRERELAQQNERLEEFASIVSHDLRNPLGIANGYLEQLRTDIDVDHDGFDQLAWALDRMDRLTEELLTLARQGQMVGDTDEVSVRAAAEAAWRSVDSEEATLVVEADQTIEADRERLVEMLQNLFSNAVEHGPADGEAVTITVESHPDGFAVADDGTGIPADDREAVLDLGHTTSEEGTGFGLYIVDTLAEAHDWDLSVGTSEGGGAQFSFTGVERR